jgi:hypothetical protein
MGTRSLFVVLVAVAVLSGSCGGTGSSSPGNGHPDGIPRWRFPTTGRLVALEHRCGWVSGNTVAVLCQQSGHARLGLVVDGGRSGSEPGYVQVIGSKMLADGDPLTFTARVPKGTVLVFGFTTGIPLELGQTAFILPAMQAGVATVRIDKTPAHEVSIELADGSKLSPTAASVKALTWPDGSRVTVSEYRSLFITDANSSSTG